MASAKSQGTGFAAKISKPFASMGRFLKDVHSELQRVVWPSHEETYSFTVVVLIAVAAVAAWVALLDVVFAKIMALLGVSG